MCGTMKANFATTREKSYPFRVGVLAIMKNRSLNIKRWVEHYLCRIDEQIYLSITAVQT
jgi:hypothetical protein